MYTIIYIPSHAKWTQIDTITLVSLCLAGYEQHLRARTHFSSLGKKINPLSFFLFSLSLSLSLSPISKGKER